MYDIQVWQFKSTIITSQSSVIMGGNLSLFFLLVSRGPEKCFQDRYETVHYCYLREWRKGACGRAGEAEEEKSIKTGRMFILSLLLL